MENVLRRARSGFHRFGIEELLATITPDLPPPMGQPVAWYAEAVQCPWDPTVVVLLLGLTPNPDLHLSGAEVFAVWNWTHVEAVRLLESGGSSWRGLEATPWFQPLRDLHERRVSLVEVRLRPRADDGLPPELRREIEALGSDEPVEPATAVELIVEAVGPEIGRRSMSGSLELRPRPWPKASPHARVALATLAWVRKAGGDPRLRELSWREVRRIVPPAGMDPAAREALLAAIDADRRAPASRLGRRFGG